MKCKKCGTETNNPQFCSLSCSNSRPKPTLRKQPHKCVRCDNLTVNPKYCSLSCAAITNNNRKSKTFRYCANNSTCSNILKYKQFKYCCRKCQQQNQWYIKKQNIEECGIIYNDDKGSTGAPLARKYIIEKYGYKCSICNIDSWQNQKLNLVLDHIDGNGYNWSINNVRFVCPNCDSQLPTFKGRNKGKGREHRRKANLTQSL